MIFEEYGNKIVIVFCKVSSYPENPYVDFDNEIGSIIQYNLIYKAPIIKLVITQSIETNRKGNY